MSFSRSTKERHWWEFVRYEERRSLNDSAGKFSSTVSFYVSFYDNIFYLTSQSCFQLPPSKHQLGHSSDPHFHLSLQSPDEDSFLLLLISGPTDHPLLPSLLFYHLSNQFLSLQSFWKHLEGIFFNWVPTHLVLLYAFLREFVATHCKNLGKSFHCLE